MKRFPIFVILDNIRSALNVGSVFRTCDAANINKLFLCGITAYPPHNKIPKTALGAVESIDWTYCEKTLYAINSLKQEFRDISIVSVEITDTATNIWDFNFKFPTALIFGNEISGIEENIVQKSDAVVKIPMYGKKESLNISTTCGIALYELLRRYREI